MTRLLYVIITFLTTTTTVPPAAGPPSVTLSVHDFAYDPAEITVPRGAIVVWINRDDMPHTITADDGAKTFSLDALDSGETFSYRFDAAGRFSYFCGLHPRMQGVVMVR